MSSTQIKKRRVMERDHQEIAEYVASELGRRKNNPWRRKHEEIWAEMDRQIEMQPPEAIDEGDGGDWHNNIQLGDQSDASETIAADVMRIMLPKDRSWFAAHVDLGRNLEEQDNDRVLRQKVANGVLRSFMAMQHRDFGVRRRFKLAIKECLHHGGVVLTVDTERLTKFHGGTRPEELVAPVPTVHSMWNCYPDPSPSVQGTELFYRGSMIINATIPLREALEMPNWINKKKLQPTWKCQLDEHIEITYYYGDLFLRRYDGNLLFPNRRTVVSGNVFLESTVNKTPYSPVIYIGYDRDDVRNPYYTSNLIKRVPMAKFTTKMTNRTMDSVDLAVDPPLAYDSTDNSLRGSPPTIAPRSQIPSRGAKGINPIAVGNPQVGLAAMAFGKQSLAEGTTVDAVRKGVSPGTEQTATEVVTTEQRAEVREVEFISTLEAGMLLPYTYMQHDLNKMELKAYTFFNDEIHTPDILRMTKSDLPDRVVFDITASRNILGEQQRAQRVIGTAQLAASVPPIAERTDWEEVTQQVWEDTQIKDPERFIRQEEEDSNVDRALAAQQEQFQQFAQQMQEQIGKMQQQLEEAEEAKSRAEAEALSANIKARQRELDEREKDLQNFYLQESLKLTQRTSREQQKLTDKEVELRERELKLQFEQDQLKAEEQRAELEIRLKDDELKRRAERDEAGRAEKIISLVERISSDRD